MKESSTEITATMGFILTLDLSENHPLAAFANFLTEQHFGSKLLEAMVESLNEVLVEAYCGEKHAQGNGTKRYRRSTSKIRTAITTAGDHQFSLGQFKYTAAGDDENTHFRPIDNVADFNGQKRYQ